MRFASFTRRYLTNAREAVFALPASFCIQCTKEVLQDDVVTAKVCTTEEVHVCGF